MIAIKHRYTGTPLCEFDVATIKDAAEKGSANLRGADLYGANLRGVNLGGANLRGANLRGENLCRADLGEAGLSGEDFSDKVGKLKANGFFSAGPLGSRNDTLMTFHTDKGIFIKAGCFFDSLELFRAKVIETHGAESIHGELYLATADLVAMKFAE